MVKCSEWSWNKINGIPEEVVSWENPDQELEIPN